MVEPRSLEQSRRVNSLEHLIAPSSSLPSSDRRRSARDVATVCVIKPELLLTSAFTAHSLKRELQVLQTIFFG